MENDVSKIFLILFRMQEYFPNALSKALIYKIQHKYDIFIS